MKKLLLAVLFTGLLSTAVYAETVSLAWDANHETDIAGYKIYKGTETGVYGAPVDVGNVLSHQLVLNSGVHYLVISAYDANGNESDKSYEIKYTAKVSRVTGFGTLGGN